MISQEFSASAMNRLRRRGAQFDYRADDGTIPISEDQWRKVLYKVQDEIIQGSYRYRSFNVKKLGDKKLLFTTKSLENILVIRKINDNVRRAYRVRQANRHDTVVQVKQALEESVPKRIYKLDIKSFYESVPKRKLLSSLKKDRLLSNVTLDLIDKLFKYTSHLGARGLPRGLQISATLSELVARRLEQDLREIDGVYYVARYVDDIIILTNNVKSDLIPDISRKFAFHGLSLNDKKLLEHSVKCRCSEGCSHKNGCPCARKCSCKPILSNNSMRELDFLGYKLAFPDVNGPNQSKPNDIGVYLADKKVDKYKRRVWRAVEDFLRTQDQEMLLKRIMYLTGNHKIAESDDGSALYGGIYYNFNLYASLAEPGLCFDNKLASLDRFLEKALLRAFKICPVTRLTVREILSLTFSNGFKWRRRRAFTPSEIVRIGACWNEL
ncbi:antiviral reverse transcriptase Drt3a [Salinicola aestuarinus]|uniref:antiviral reverse transcriptase Drt3a n=1 Tax=Salinicola aestuarinus TaxID=1949082 RepID=UPI0013006F4A|nr:antiviral reverse transcriptase Drt3a [Salinicola aestuarinus]